MCLRNCFLIDICMTDNFGYLYEIRDMLDRQFYFSEILFCICRVICSSRRFSRVQQIKDYYLIDEGSFPWLWNLNIIVKIIKALKLVLTRWATDFLICRFVVGLFYSIKDLSTYRIHPECCSGLFNPRTRTHIVCRKC